MEDDRTPLMIVFGKTGVGKSTFLNFLCSSEAFKVGHSLESETEEFTFLKTEIEQTPVMLCDTIGFLNNKPIENYFDKFSMFLQEIKSGINLIIIVISVLESRINMTPLEQVINLLGFDCYKNVIIVFSQGDCLSKEKRPEIYHKYTSQFSDLFRKRCIPFKDSDYLFFDEESKDSVKSRIVHDIKDKDKEVYVPKISNLIIKLKNELNLNDEEAFKRAAKQDRYLGFFYEEELKFNGSSCDSHKESNNYNIYINLVKYVPFLLTSFMLIKFPEASLTSKIFASLFPIILGIKSLKKKINFKGILDILSGMAIFIPKYGNYASVGLNLLSLILNLNN